MNKKDSLGDRMKGYYESITKYFLPRKTYTIIRLDGKAFHTYTHGLQKPFDDKFVNDMNETALYLCKNIQGAKLAFVQSDEISILLTDFDKLTTDLWFGGNIQKMASVSASMATAWFNYLRPGKLALFDSRVFTISSRNEVVNYFIWRQQDTVRNSISSVAQSIFSHKLLDNKNVKMMQEMCFASGTNWNDFSTGLKQGRVVYKNNNEDGAGKPFWSINDAHTFICDTEYSNDLIPEQL